MSISLSKKIDMFSYIWKLGYVCLKKKFLYRHDI